ncbi:MAG: TrkH family potassium uptake protein, partial [Lachnospiraceae bacterium]|nr:TrkH family potassium uptake protein [Candidatus Minthocola equi]
MNFKMIASTLRRLLFVEGLLMLVPTVVALIYKESVFPFLVVAVPLIIIGSIKNPTNLDKTIYGKEGLFIVAAVWVLWSLFGALPYVISGAIPSYVDAVFETVSGFTTTGSSILTDVESLPHGILFWRSFAHFIGGMGVLVFVLAIIPLAENRSMYIMKAEMPGPSVDKLVPKTKETAKILYLIYVALTALLVVLLLAGGMPLFDSLIHAFGTAGTGGFSIKSASIAAYNSPYIESVITAFMLIFGINFNVFYLLLIGKFSRALRNTELWFYLGTFVVATLIITVNIKSGYAANADATRDAAFQVASVMSTTGYSTADFSLWPGLSQSILMLLMIGGACAGSTAGGFKLIRVILLGKILRQDVKKVIRPRVVSKLRLDGKIVEDDAIMGIKNYTLFYIAVIVITYIILSFDGFDITTTVSSVLTCLN